MHGLLAAGVRHLIVEVSAARDCDPQLLTMLACTRADGGDALPIRRVSLPQFLTSLQAAALAGSSSSTTPCAAVPATSTTQGR